MRRDGFFAQTFFLTYVLVIVKSGRNVCLSYERNIHDIFKVSRSCSFGRLVSC